MSVIFRAVRKETLIHSILTIRGIESKNSPAFNQNEPFFGSVS